MAVFNFLSKRATACKNVITKNLVLSDHESIFLDFFFGKIEY